MGMKETVVYVSHGNFGWKGMTEYIYNYGTQNTGKKISEAEFDFEFFLSRGSKPHFPASPSFYIWNVVWNSYSYIYLQFLDHFSKKGRG